MKRRICIGLAVCVLCFVSVAEAHLVQANFNDLVAGNLSGQSGGVGLSGSYSGSGTVDVFKSADLVAPAGTNFGLTQSGDPTIVNGSYSSGRMAGCDIAEAMTGTVWGSFLVVPHSDGFNGIGFNTTGSTSAKPHIRCLNRLRLYYAPPSGAVATADNALLDGTNLILFRIIIDADGSNDDVTLWINPDVTDLASETPAIAKASVDFVGSSITRLNIISYNTASNQVDMVTLSNDADAYFDVTGVLPAYDPALATNPSPANEAPGVSPICPKVVLHWTPGDYVDGPGGAPDHRIYFSTVFDDVNDGNDVAKLAEQDANEYPVSPAPGLDLEYGTTYYWRVDEANSPWDEGNVWRFTTEAHQIPNASITATADSNEADKGPENTVDLEGDLHSNLIADMWVSIQGAGAWIQYEFDRVYKLDEMRVWNYNQEFNTVFGANEVTIKYSVDGIGPYDTLGTTHDFNEAPGTVDYAANTTIDFEGVSAKYVRIDVNSTFGGPQAGLSEVRFFYMLRHAELVSPGDEEKRVEPNVTLVWQKPFVDITEHRVYISTDFNDVNDRIVDPCIVTPVEGLCDTQASYSLSLEYYKTYYWTVDEHYAAEDPNVGKSDQVWSFTVTYNPALIVDVNLVGWWKLDGDAKDSSGYGNHGEPRGDVGYAAGTYGQALDCDGSDDYVYTGKTALDLNIDVNKPKSTTAWVYTRAFDNCAIWYLGNGGGGEEWCLTTTSVTNQWRVRHRGGDNYDFYYTSQNEWVHFALVYDGSESTCYADGSVISSQACDLNTTNDNPFRIGARASGYFFDGLIDEVRIYDKALTQAEVRAISRVDLEKAWKPRPADKATDVPTTPILMWNPGDYAPAGQHRISFGTNPVTMPVIATQGPNTLPAGSLDLGETYYWAVDEQNGAGWDLGRIWSFTVTEFLVVDSFDNYPFGEMWKVWIDGAGDCLGNDTNSAAILYEESVITYDSNGSMKYLYDNDGTVGGQPCGEPNQPKYSRAVAKIADLPSGIDPNWLVGSPKALVLMFQGIFTNDPNEEMWLELTDDSGKSAKVTYGPHLGEDDINDVNETSWHQWNIDFQEFVDSNGVSLAEVNAIAIGFGNPGETPSPGWGYGTMYIDDIRLYPTRCLLEKRDPSFARFDYAPTGPGGDCVIDAEELDVMFGDWMIGDYNVVPTAPDPCGLVARYEFEQDVCDSSVNGFHGTYNGTAPVLYVLGVDGNAIDLDGVDNYVSTGKSASDLGIGGSNPKSTTAWVYTRAFDNCAIWHLGGTGGGAEWCLTTTSDTNQWRVRHRGAGNNYEFDYPSHNEWVHFALVYDAERESTCYADGQPVSSITITLNTVNDDPFRIGARASGYFFDGLIDDVRIYDYALSPNEIVSVRGLGTVYVPLVSPANFYNEEPPTFKRVNFKDYALLVDEWLEKDLFPPEGAD